MQLKLLQLNVYAGTYWNDLAKYLKTHNFDILQLQEIVGADTHFGNIASTENVYEKISELLGNTYQGRLHKTETFSSSPTAFDGNATFVKKDIFILEEKTIMLKEAVFPFDSNRRDFENIGRGALALKVKKGGKTMWLVNTHLAWSPSAEDTDEKIRQAALLSQFLASLQEPFIFSGDLNAASHTKTIQLLNHNAKNLTSFYQITNTLSPHLHKANHLFPPGLAVDYIFVSPRITILDFAVVEENISDHLGLTATVEL